MNPSPPNEQGITESHYTVENLNQRVLADPSTSYWLKEQWQILSNRDVVDALNDLEILTLMLTNKLYGTNLNAHS